MDEREWVLTGQAARLLGISAERVRELANRGVLRVRRVAGIRLLDRAEVERLAEERARKRRAAELDGR